MAAVTWDSAMGSGAVPAVGQDASPPSEGQPVLRQCGSFDRRRKQWLIFYHESMSGVAHEVKELMGQGAELGQLEWKRFDDGFPNLQISKRDCQRLEDFYGTILLVSFHNTEVIFDQICLLQELPRMRARNYHIVLPWFCTGTMERVESLGQIATASSLASLLSCTPQGPSGLPTILIYDIHWLQELFYFSDQVLVELRTALSLGTTTLHKLKAESPEEVVIVFPDEGAQEKMTGMFSSFAQVVCDKVRDGARRNVSIRSGAEHIAGSHCVIIDDMVMSGALMLECAAKMQERGASKVSCFTVHAVMPKEAWRKFLGKGLHRFWITNTVPSTAAAVAGHEPFEVLSIAPLIAEYLCSMKQLVL